MGIYTDLASTNPIPAKPRIGLDRSSGEQLLSKASLYDPSVGSTFASTDDVQLIPEQTSAATADTYTLTFNYPNLAIGGFTTASIAFDAADSVVETAIDVAATAASVTGWTNGDITVLDTGSAGLDDGTLTLTSDGTSVAGQPADLITLAPTGFTQDGTITKTANGQGDRKATEALFGLNVVAGSLTDVITAPTWTKPETNGQQRPRTKLIRDLCIQAKAEDGNENVFDAVVALYPQVAKV